MRFTQAVVGLVVVLVGAAIGVRQLQLGGPSPASARTATAAAPAPVSPERSVAVPPGSSAGSVALQWMDLLARNRAKPAVGPTETELLRSQERELAQELQVRLQRDPAGWGDVLEVLCQEDPRIGREIVASLRDAVGDGSEAPLLQLLKTGRHREVRLAAVTLISRRTSSDSLWALVAAAQEDADAGVRYQALSQLAMRQGRLPAEAPTIEPLVRLRAQTDPDLEVRRFAQRLEKQ